MQLVSTAFIVTVQKHDFPVGLRFSSNSGSQPVRTGLDVFENLAVFGCGPSALRREQASSRDRASRQGLKKSEENCSGRKRQPQAERRRYSGRCSEVLRC